MACNADSLTVSKDDGWTQQYGKTTHRYLLDLGECKAGTKIHITNLNAETIEYHVYRLNFKAMCTAYETLSEQTMTLEKMTDRKIVGSIDVGQAERLILSVPADEGWTLYVDGKKDENKAFRRCTHWCTLKRRNAQNRAALYHTGRTDRSCHQRSCDSVIPV